MITIEAVPRFGCVLPPYPPQPPIASPRATIVNTAVAVSSEGPYSKGLHVVGRKETPFEDTERAVIARLSGSIGRIVHSLEQPSATPDVRQPAGADPIRVAVEMLSDHARAEVSAPFGDEIRTGTGEAGTGPRAVALAVIDAVDASFKLRDTVEGEIAGERAVLVLLSDQADKVSLGAALVDRSASDALRATASAALEAAQRLGSR